MEDSLERITTYLEDLEYDQLELFLAEEGDYDDELHYSIEDES